MVFFYSDFHNSPNPLSFLMHELWRRTAFWQIHASKKENELDPLEKLLLKNVPCYLSLGDVEMIAFCHFLTIKKRK